jgi:hypothetical protein
MKKCVKCGSEDVAHGIGLWLKKKEGSPGFKTGAKAFACKECVGNIIFEDIVTSDYKWDELVINVKLRLKFTPKKELTGLSFYKL